MRDMAVARFVQILLASLVTRCSASWTGRHAGLIAAEKRKISPPPPPPMDRWTASQVAGAADAAGLNGTFFEDHDVDGVALHELATLSEKTSEIPKFIAVASEKHGPQLVRMLGLEPWTLPISLLTSPAFEPLCGQRFLHRLRKWRTSAEKPVPPLPLRPPPPPPPEPNAPPPKSPKGLFG